jgi:hypothetical protein
LRGVQLFKQLKNDKIKNNKIYYCKIRLKWEFFKICRGIELNVRVKKRFSIKHRPPRPQSPEFFWRREFLDKNLYNSYINYYKQKKQFKNSRNREFQKNLKKSFFIKIHKIHT